MLGRREGLDAVKMPEPVRRFAVPRASQSCASSTAAPQLQTAPCFLSIENRHCLLATWEEKKEGERKKEKIKENPPRTSIKTRSRTKPPCTAGAACTARPEESEIKVPIFVPVTLLALCSVRASVTQPGPTGCVFRPAAPNAGLAAQHGGHSGAMLDSLEQLLLLCRLMVLPLDGHSLCCSGLSSRSASKALFLSWIASILSYLVACCS